MLRHMIAGLAVSLISLPALADEPVTIAEIGFGEDLIEKTDEYGERELERLAEEFREDLERALAGIELADGTVLEATILDADPNRPTMRQLSRNPGLSYIHSFSRGGAEVAASLVSAEGDVLESYEYSWSTPRIQDARHKSTWTDAQRTFRSFAHRIADDLQEREDAGS